MVLVETNYGSTGAGTSTGPAIRYTSATSKHMYVRADNTAPTGNGTVTSYRPNIRITKSSGSLSPEINTEITENEIISISAFPNPTTGLIKVSSSGKIESIDVYNVTGAKVLSMPVRNGKENQEVDLSDLHNGMYLLVVNDGNKKHSLKVLKN
jgi:hypothetical protein